MITATFISLVLTAPLMATPPNILLIVAEDMSPRVGAYGDTVANTPALDALARQGVRFDRVFATSGVCAPNRSSLITGVYPQSMGTQHMRTVNRGYLAVPPAEVKAFPQLLRAAGYATANATKTDYQFGEPSSIWDVQAGGYTDPTDLALWRRLPQDKPFFAMINLMITHESQLATAETRGQGRLGAFVEQVARGREGQIPQITDLHDVTVPPYYPDTPQVRASIAQHYDNIGVMDGQVAQILANLQADDLARETVVIWTTDHGDGFPRAKRGVYDSGLHIPLILRYPDQARAGEVDDRLVSMIDLAPMVLGLADVDIPDFIQGRDVLSPEVSARRYIHAGRDRMDEVPDRVRAVRDQRFKYMRNFMPELAYFRPLAFRDMFPIMQALWDGRQAGTLAPAQASLFIAPRAQEELYDTLDDPHEINNLADNPNFKSTLERLRDELARWLRTAGDLSAEDEADMIARMWPGGEQPVTAPPDLVQQDAGLSLRSATPGSAVEYACAANEQTPQHWALYVQPLDKGVCQTATLYARAVRYGYAPSETVQFNPAKENRSE